MDPFAPKNTTATVDFSKFTVEDMEGATVAFLILAMLNWIAQFGKYFVYFWFVLGLEEIIATLMGAVSTVTGGVDTSSVASATAGANAFAGLASTFTKLLAKFTVIIPAGLFVGTMLNSALTFWPMIAYRSKYELDAKSLGYFYSSCQAFYYGWLILGWAPTVMFMLDGILAAPFGTGSFGGWGLNLFIIEASLYALTTIVLSWVFPAFDAWFIKNHVD